MATFTSTSGSYTTTLTVTQTSQSTQNNQSTLTYSLTLTKNSGTGLWNNNSCPWSITIDGSQVASGTFTYDFRNYSSLTLKSSTTTTVNHNSDGTKTVSVSASVNMNNSDYVSVMQPSGSLTLTTIPRASEVSVSNYSITNTTGSLSATITSKANFYHKWRWKIGSGSWSAWTNKGQINNTSSTVTVANTSLLAGMPTSTSASFNIEVQTYSDSGYANLVGTKSATCTVSVNTSNIKPSISLGNIAINSSPISGYAVAGYSSVKSTATTTNSSGASSFTNYFTVSSGSLTSSTSTSASTTVTTNTVPSSSSNYTLTIYAYAKDSRGAVSSTVSKSITVYGYQPPTATLNAYRVADSTSTTEDGAGTYAYVTFSGAVSSSVNSQNTIQSTSCTYSGSISGTATNGGHYALSDTQTVTFTLTVRDKVTSSTAQKTISTASYPLDLYDNGNGTVGVGLGTVAVANELRSPLNTRVATHEGNSTFTVGDASKATGRSYGYVRSGGGAIYFGAGEKDGTWVAWCDVLNQAGSGKEILTVNQNLDVNWKGDIDGNASTSTNATYVNWTESDTSSQTDYYIPFGGSYTTATNRPLRSNSGLRYNTREGTTTTRGVAQLRLGNSTAEGTAGNKKGGLMMYANNSYYTFITPADAPTANRTIYVPSVPANSDLQTTTTILSSQTLKGGNSTTVTNGALYRRLRVYAYYGAYGYTMWEIDVEKITTTATHFDHSSPIYISDPGDWYLTIFEVTCTKSGNNVTLNLANIYNKRIGTSGQSTQNNNNNYYIYQVQGLM